MHFHGASSTPQPLKIDLMGRWIETEWLPNHPEPNLMTLWTDESCVHQKLIEEFDNTFELPEDFRFAGFEAIACDVIPRVSAQAYNGDLSHRSGAYEYTFTSDDNTVKVLVMAAFFSDEGEMICLVALPEDFVPVWTAFSRECQKRYRSLSPSSQVVIIGGHSASFVPTVEWDDVILPHKLKGDLLEDVESFFTRGIDVYRRLKLKPFRKLLLAGVPGTGKTMLCSALAKWSLERDYLVIYISSADHAGSTFGKIQHALVTASNSSVPTLVILEELDAYLHEEEKALVLNVLDGSESSVNDKGTLLVATTNYPEAIDERVLKRPGRLDRVFIIPETRHHEDAEKMLRQYIGDMWQDEHVAIVPDLVGYPGAFIREVAVYALTQVAFEDLDALSLNLLQRSFDGLKEQIDAKDDFLTRQARYNGWLHNRDHL